MKQIQYNNPRFKMQERQGAKPMPVSEYANTLIIDMKSLSNSLKPISKNLYENNNRILNELLAAKQGQIAGMAANVLAYVLQVSQYKQLITTTLALLNKTINCIKTLAAARTQDQRAQLQGIIGQALDTLISVSTLHKDTQETSLRILQSTFSLIDHTLVPYFDDGMLTRMFSICFEFCRGASIVQNISVSALFALIEVLIQFGNVKASYSILEAFLQYLFESKRFIWIKGDVKGLVWDLTVIAVKNFTAHHIIGFDANEKCKVLLNKMYDIVVESIFMKKTKDFYSLPAENPKQKTNGKSPHKISQAFVDFLRYFKAYVHLSSSLSIQAFRVVQQQLVPFRATIPKMMLVCDLERNSRMFIFLQAVCHLLLDAYEIPLSTEKGMVFMEILSRISEELCLTGENVKVNWDSNENFLDKIINEEPRIMDGDFVRVIKNTIVELRIKYQKDKDLQQCRKMKRESARSTLSGVPEHLSSAKRWEHMIRNVIRVIRYMASINFIVEESEEDPTRKFILELQYWFLLCPAARAKNMVLQELLITANVLNNKMQAVKVSQSVQIGSNILYGYYEDLDSTGLTIILKMMAGIKADWEEGKSFEELDEIYNLCSNIYSEKELVKSEVAFTTTVQALVQCANSLIADTEQPKDKSPATQQSTLKRSFKMIDFLIQRLIVVVNRNLAWAVPQWNFLTAFFITLCFNKSMKIKEEGVRAVGVLVKDLLKNQLGPELDAKKEHDVMGLYLELCKAQIKQIELLLIEQLKAVMPRIQQQEALMDGFKIMRILSDGQKNSKQVVTNLHELQEILIKECLFRITETKYLRAILDGMQVKTYQKNEQYRLINLLWSVADYLRKITPRQSIPYDFIQLWEALFKNIWSICENTKQCETKQSAIHSMTQILAETIGLLPFDFIIVIISKYYQEMLLLLLGIHSSSPADTEKSPETAKVALKNFVKIFKKLITLENKTQKDTHEVEKNIHEIIQNITAYIQKHVNNRNSGNITLEILYQILNFIALVEEDKGFQDLGVSEYLKILFQAIESLISICEQEPNSKMDLKSHMYKKKVKPLIEKIKQNQARQIEVPAATFSKQKEAATQN